MTSEAKIRNLLDDGKIERLFRNELLWDKPTGIGPVTVLSGTTNYQVRPVAAKKNFVVFECDSLPTADERVRIERAVARRAIENLIVYKGQNGARHVVWTEAKPGRAPHAYVHAYTATHPNQDLLQRLAQLAFTLADQASLNLVTVRARVQSALAADRITKTFYDSFAKQHASLSASIENVAGEDDRSWYSSVLLNRLMFLYFLQRKGFLDGDRAYLRNRLTKIRELRGPDNFYTFFREFLLPLFHTSLAARDSQPDDAEIADLIGDVPYLNGGMFGRHELERRYENVEVPDAAFASIFRFFDSWKWTLDDRATAGGNEINPDILGYIFERYINQKQMGAYYTKEDVTGYMTSATIVPWFLDRLSARLAERGIDFDPYQALVSSEDRYLYAAPLTGVDEPLPSGFPATGSAMAGNELAGQPASPKYGLPGESWAECLDRIDSQRRLRATVNSGEIKSSNAAVTANVNLIALATDLLRDTNSADVLEVAYEVLINLTVLDPACGSGAFLFAALDLLVVLYRTCVESMEQYLLHNTQQPGTDTTQRFTTVLSEAAKHPSRDYFLHKSVTLNNLFGVDLMPEAVEIAKLRLFLSLVEHVGSTEELEPLPDLDFNLRAGNTLIGFTSPAQVDAVLAKTLDVFDTASGSSTSRRRLPRRTKPS